MSKENPDAWEAPDLTEAELKVVDKAINELGEVMPQAIMLNTAEDVNNLTEDQAYAVLRQVRRSLAYQLLHQERHQHMMDDCGDYLTAATDNWANLFGNLWMNDFQNLVEEVKLFLTDFEMYPIGGCDGEARYEILPESMLYPEDTTA